MKDQNVYTMKLSRHQLIHLRRVLNRGIACAEGRCRDDHPFEANVWHYVRGVHGRIESHLKRKPNASGEGRA